MAGESRIGVGIIGLSADGGWAATAHLPALRRIEGFSVRAVSASSPESARRSAERHGIEHAASSPEELASHDGVDLVVVAVKVPRHRALAAAALNAGKAVYCEWPLGLHLGEAREMARMADAAAVRHFVGLQARAAPAVRYIRHLVQDGFVGEVLSTSVVGSGGRWGASIPAASLYLTERANGATLLSIPFGHTLDGVEFCLGSTARLSAKILNRRNSVRIDETGETVPVTAPDQVLMQGILETGAAISMHYRGGLSEATNFLWEINGTLGDLQITAPNGHMQYGQLTIRGARHGAGPMRNLPVPPAFRPFPDMAGSLVESLAVAYGDVHEDMRSGSRTAPDFHAAVRRHLVLDAMETASSVGLEQVPG